LTVNPNDNGLPEKEDSESNNEKFDYNPRFA
jgi:hypothetical protein